MRVSALPPDVRFALVHNRAACELPFGAACENCEVSEPLVLKRTDPGSLLCHECFNEANGRSRIEVHHLGGRWDTEYTVFVGANVHAVLTLLQDCYWRGSHGPGSAYALGFDVAAHLAYTVTEDKS